MEIRKLKLSDWQIQKRLILDSLKNNPDSFSNSPGEWYEGAAKAFFRSGGVAYALVDDQGECGILMGRKESLGHMWIAPRVRRMGNGKKLLNKFLAWNRENYSSVIRIYVTKQKPAINFYESMGFKRTGNEQGKMIKMELKL